MILILGRYRGGPVEGFMGGGSLETFSGEAQLKKTTLYMLQKDRFQSHSSIIHMLHTYFVFELKLNYNRRLAGSRSGGSSQDTTGANGTLLP